MSMENKMLQIAQERYTTKHYSGKKNSTGTIQ